MIIKNYILLFSSVFLFVNLLFAQNKDTTNKVIIDKYIYYNYNFKKTSIDTQLIGFQLYNTVNENYFYDISLGNIGLPILSITNINFYKTNDFIFSKYMEKYIFDVDNVSLYKTNRRFTNVTFYNNGSKSKAENVVKIFHSQNINPYLNISFKYNLINSLGYYKYQASKDNMLNFTMFYDKNRITSFFIINYNILSYQNNGGIENDTSVFDSDSYQPELVPVNLNSSVSKLKNINIDFVSRYNFGNKIDTIISDSSTVSYINRKSFVEYNFKFDKNKYLYNDVYNDFYKNYYYSDSASFDSLTNFTIHNSLSVSNFNNDYKNIVYALGANFDLNKFHYTNFSSLYSDVYINADIFYRLNKFNLGLKSKYFINGLKGGDYNINLSLMINKIYLSFENILQTPNYFMNNLFTNNFIWHNNFNKTLIFSSAIKYNFNKLFLINFKVSSISNYIYFNSECVPVQLGSSFVYLKFGLLKKLRYKKINFISKNNLQYLPNNSYFSLPFFVTYNSVFYQTFLVKKVLKMQFGLDFFYNTSFNGYSYMPSLSTYYVSTDVIGGYPYFDAFVNLKLKRVNFMLKLIHVNQKLFGGKYISISNYPLMERGVRFGISWNFYD